MRVVVDASVAVKWVLNEEWSPEALALLDEGNLLLSPDHMIAEVANVLWKYFQRGELSQEEALSRAEFLGELPVELVAASELLPTGMKVACEQGIAVYDALYVSLALREGIQLVTVDDHLLRKLSLTPYSTSLQHIQRLHYSSEQ